MILFSIFIFLLISFTVNLNYFVFGQKILKFNVQGSVLHRKCILMYIQQDATLHSLFLETAVHVSDDTSTLHQEHIQLYLQHLVLVKL